MFHTYRNVRIAGIRTAVPELEISLESELQYYGDSLKKVERIRKMVGMDKRRVCPIGVTASDLCAHAAEQMLQDSPGWKDSIDALIFVSQSPDWHQPATACELQHRLSLPRNCATFDVNQGCAGFVYGMWIGGALIESGAAKRVLLLVGDALSFGRDTRNRIMAPVFGDGGSATLLERQNDASPMHFGIGTDGSGFEAVISPAGKARIPFVRQAERNNVCVEDIYDKSGNPWQLFDTYMDGEKVFSFTMDVVPNHILSAMEHAKTSPDALQWLILHQANKQIMENIANKVGFSLNKVPTQAFSKFGNLAAASIPSALCDTFGNGQTPGSVLLCGYGVGLSWASCICSINEWNCAPVIEYNMPEDHPQRDQLIERWKRIIKGE